MVEQDAIIKALSKKVNLLEADLGDKQALLDEYESKFVQVREAVNSEKDRYESQLVAAADQIED